MVQKCIEKYFFFIFFLYLISSNTHTDKTQRCHFILRSECIWNMLKSNKNTSNNAIATTQDMPDSISAYSWTNL